MSQSNRLNIPAEALSIADIKPGLAFEVLDTETKEAKQVGVFFGNVEGFEDEETWPSGLSAEVVLEGSSTPEKLNLYEAGVTCSRSGEWAAAYMLRRLSVEG